MVLCTGARTEKVFPKWLPQNLKCRICLFVLFINYLFYLLLIIEWGEKRRIGATLCKTLAQGIGKYNICIKCECDRFLHVWGGCGVILKRVLFLRSGSGAMNWCIMKNGRKKVCNEELGNCRCEAIIGCQLSNKSAYHIFAPLELSLVVWDWSKHTALTSTQMNSCGWIEMPTVYQVWSANISARLTNALVA